MRYGRILADAWDRLWHAWALWGIVATPVGLMAVIMGGLVFAFGTVFVDVFATAPSGEPDLVALLALTGIALVFGLVMVPVAWLFRSASIHVANEALEGRPVHYVDGLKAGARRLGSLALFEVILMVIAGVAVGVVAVLWAVMFASLVATGDGGEGAIAAVLGTLCFMYVIIFVIYLAAILLVQSFEAVGSRAAVLSGRTGMQAFSDAWSALRHSFKAMVVMGLIVLGIMWGYSILTSAVLTPLQFMFMPQIFDPVALETADPVALFSSMSVFYALYMALSLLLTFPLTVFTDLIWTGFYRQLVGITPAEELPQAPVYSPVMPQPPVAQGYESAPPVAGMTDVIPPPPGQSDSADQT